jgi:hypothetical protein
MGDLTMDRTAVGCERAENHVPTVPQSHNFHVHELGMDTARKDAVPNDDPL